MSEYRQLPFGRPLIGNEEKEAVIAVLSGDILTHGPQAKAFESEFSGFMGNSVNAITTSSGMAALHLAYWQLGIGHGDEVIVPAQTHVATVHAVEYLGATPIFADCDLLTGNITAETIAKLITPRTKAIGIVHFLGIPCDMRSIMALAENHGLMVIEDCALALGTSIAGKHVGTFGHAGIFSFYPVKHITTGDGGMFISRLEELSSRVAKARAFGVDRSFAERTLPGVYDVPTLGLNYRMSDINAAIGRVQLTRIASMLDKREKNFTRLKQNLNSISNLSILDNVNPNHKSSYYCLTILLNDKLREMRNELVHALNIAGIGTSVYYPHPIPRLTYYRDKYNIDLNLFPNASRISDESIALPVGPHLGLSDMDYIADVIIKKVKERK